MRCKREFPCSPDVHVHEFMTRTTVDDGHRHNMRGFTAPEVDCPGHVHYYEGTTSYEDGHVHQFCGCTGHAIYRREGHTHRFSGETSYDDGHDHGYRDMTEKDVPGLVQNHQF